MPVPLRSLPPPAKKRKIQKNDDFVKSVQELEKTISDAINDNSSLNPLVDLLQLANSARDVEHISKAIYVLYRLFVTIISAGRLDVSGDEAAKIVKTWIWDQLSAYVSLLSGLLKDSEATLRISALQILLSLQKHLSVQSSKASSTPQFHVSHFKRVVSALLSCPSSARNGYAPSDGGIASDILTQFYDTWFSVYDDIRWFFLRESATLLNNHPDNTDIPLNLLVVLERLNKFPTEVTDINEWWVPDLGTNPPKPKKSKKATNDNDSDTSDAEAEGEAGDDDDWRKFFDDEDDEKMKKAKTPAARLHKLTVHQSLHSLSSHRAVFTRTWLSLLPRLSFPGDAVLTRSSATRVLNTMHHGILPHLTRPILVMDWIGSCVDLGGSVGLLSLNALFILLRDYNLDYPSFYSRLYAFLDRDALHVKHRARFFRMTELFLSSTHLPAALLASFVKRLARLSLSAPPAAIVMIIPFSYNILKRHPNLMLMIHRTDYDGSDADPYDASEPNPMLSNAIRSSLWELNTHISHYHPSVSTLAKIFSEAFTKPNYKMEDFLDHTYATLFETEANRKIKREPALAMDIKSSTLFVAPANPEVDSSIVETLWRF
ncbi:CBF-domain-containing protein [Fistulina hepatica ATCC 64428]|uniref:CBF-domain-containing protein n=1 Tax=Fistulina hepatica ATCC 64428 TaxID=1128425 RepID=A0A0D7AT14_9AGAR|nr:CBF-domain-containing protein [Fistulina hepatica ATCC 64428]